MVNYANGKIYKIINDVNGMVYVGSTTRKLCERMSNHRGNYKYKRTSTYEKFGNIADCKIILIENCNCNNKEQLLQKERYYIESMECVNKEIPCRSDKEYKEYQKEYHKEYRINNKDKLLEQQKEYNEKNKDKIKEYHKEYYINNKEKIEEQKKIKFTCKCGSTFRKSDKLRHERSIKHQKYIENNL